MKKAQCDEKMVDHNMSHEAKIHGRLDFPYIVYMGKIPEFFRSFPLHWHEEFEIIWIKKGSANFRVLSEDLSCGKNDLVIIPPNCIHSIRQNDSERAKYFNILFKFSLLEPDENSLTFKKYFEPFVQENNFLTCLTAGSSLNKKLLPIIKSLVRNRHEKYETQELMVKSGLFAAMHLLQGAIKTLSPAGKKDSQIMRLKPVLRFVNENYGWQITVEHAARLCAMSAPHFMRCFKKETGSTFIHYLNQVRLENAQTLLRTTNLTVLEVSTRCGFNNFSYFIRSYRKFFGRTPGSRK